MIYYLHIYRSAKILNFSRGSFLGPCGILRGGSRRDRLHPQNPPLCTSALHVILFKYITSIFPLTYRSPPSKKARKTACAGLQLSRGGRRGEGGFPFHFRVHWLVRQAVTAGQAVELPITVKQKKQSKINWQKFNESLFLK